MLGERIDDDVKQLILESANIKKIARRVEAAHEEANVVRDENFKHIMELRMCKKEFFEQEMHWKKVNINLATSAREESAALKRELSKKKNLLIAARKMTESNAA